MAEQPYGAKDDSLELCKRILNLPVEAVFYYPASNTHIGPASVFKRHRVIHVDTDKSAMDALSAMGLEAYSLCAKSFKPPVETSVVIQYNSALQKPFELLKQGGYALCNNWSGTATYLRENPSFRLVGIITKKHVDDTPEYVTERLEEFWTKVENDDEYKRTAEYLFEDARSHILHLTGRVASEGSVLRDYLALREEGAKRKPFTLGTFRDPETGHDCTLLPPPYKRGSTADLWIFCKKT